MSVDRSYENQRRRNSKRKGQGREEQKQGRTKQNRTVAEWAAVADGGRQMLGIVKQGTSYTIMSSESTLKSLKGCRGHN